MQKILSEKKKIKLGFHEALCKIMGVKHKQNVLMLLCSQKPALERSDPFPVRRQSPVALRAGPARLNFCEEGQKQL